jgi:hypothetical protein
MRAPWRDEAAMMDVRMSVFFMDFHDDGQGRNTLANKTHQN